MSLEPLSPLLDSAPDAVPTAPRGRLRAVTPDEPSLPEAMAGLLRRGERVPDEGFDRLLEPAPRAAAAVHWTPIDVCLRVTKLLGAGAGDRILDVGSGVGKLCIIGSLVCEAQFVGVEQRPHLVEQAARAAALLRSPATFHHANAFDFDWSHFQGLYFYNPYDEVRFAPELRIDETIRFGDALFRVYVERAQTRLAGLPDGTRVVTFHGLGGPMPQSYQLLAREHAAGGLLELWQQAAAQLRAHWAPAAVRR